MMGVVSLVGNTVASVVAMMVSVVVVANVVVATVVGRGGVMTVTMTRIGGGLDDDVAG